MQGSRCKEADGWCATQPAGVRGVGIVSMLAGAEELAAAGAVESAGSVVEWVERYLASA